MNQPVIVILVDNKRRDLPASALIAEHVEKLGGTCVLAPLEAYRSVLQAYKPSLILFNHLLAMHLVEYSQRLRDIGVKVAVLPNEMLLYHEDFLLFNTRKRHPDTHVDIYLSWGQFQKKALIENGYNPNKTKILVIGNPKFDFYFEPYSRFYLTKDKEKSERPRVLLCTNFCFAVYQDAPKEEVDRFFKLWNDKVPIFKDYKKAVNVCYKSRNKFIDFLDIIVRSEKYEITLRPHPGEDSKFYYKYLNALPENLRRHVSFDESSSIYEQILNCDIEISCETCTTALESWLAKKPTIELIFDRHEMYYHHEISLLNEICESPDTLIEKIDYCLENPAQPNYSGIRSAHLKKWLNSPDGNSCYRVAKILMKEAEGVSPDWSLLNFSDWRRGLKHKLLEFLGKPCNYNIMDSIRHLWPSGSYSSKEFTQGKTITPLDVLGARDRVKSIGLIFPASQNGMNKN